MALSSLFFSGFRNLHDARLNPDPHINLFYGENGAGKTSLLEVIHTLALGKSFRTNSFQKVIAYQADYAAVSGLWSDAVHPQLRVGIQRYRNGELKAKAGGEALKSVAQLARIIPVLVLEPHSLELLEGSPKLRRRFMDWGVFHVKHQFHGIWLAFQKALKQRNSLLKRGRIDADYMGVWDRELAQHATQIDQFRQEFLSAFRLQFDAVCKRLIDFGTVELRYQRGWDTDMDYRDFLAEHLGKDAEAGFTRRGPHRADLRIKIEGRLAQEVLSRGQTKMLVFALRLAQLLTVCQLTQQQPVVLVDDLPSELDGDHRQKVAALLCDSGAQLFITGVARADLDQYWQERPYKMFHVEHGRVKQEDGFTS